MTNHQILASDLPFRFDGLEDRYGTIRFAELVCPGVYYISAVIDETRPYVDSEYYVVMESSPVISSAAHTYGTPLPAYPQALLYSIDDYFDKGRHIVKYEIDKYLLEQREPLPKGETLLEDRVRGMEVCPEYFGEFPIPAETPWGAPVRHDRLWNGLYWLETEQVGGLAIAYPYCEELFEQTKALATLLENDRERGIENTCGYRFYPYNTSCFPLFEMRTYAEDAWGSKINYAALKNAILETFSAYAQIYNDLFPRNRRILPSPGAGTEFYHFQKAQ